MNEKTENPVPEYLQAIRSQLDGIEQNLRDLTFRVNKLERGQADIMETLAHHSGQFDRSNERLARIEKRLDLVDH